MRVPLTWLREYVDLPAEVTGRELADRLTLAGLEVETVDALGADITGPIVYGRVLTIEELTGFKKPIRFCTVDVGRANGTGEPQEIVCGASGVTAFRRILLPLVFPSLASSMLLVFALASRELVASVVVAPVGMQTIATFIWRQFEQGSIGLGMAMAFIAICITTLLPLILMRLMRRGNIVAD